MESEASSNLGWEKKHHSAFSGVRKINFGNNLQKSCGQVVVRGNFPKHNQIFLSEIYALVPAAIGLAAGINAGRRWGQPRRCGGRDDHSGPLQLGNF